MSADPVPSAPGLLAVEWRTKILQLEEAMRHTPGHQEGVTREFPVRHHFAHGLVAREIFMPAGSVVTGRIHKVSHIVFLVEGTVLVIDEFSGRQMLTAPEWFVSPRGVKRALAMLEDTRFLTVHATDERDPFKIEDALTVLRYEDLVLEEEP